LASSNVLKLAERGREGPSGARKIIGKKKFALPEEDISTLILFNIYQPHSSVSTVTTKYYSSYVAVPILRKITKI
jgi:hypothetical protein